MPLGLLSLAANLKDFGSIKIYNPKIRIIKKTDYKKVATDILKSTPGVIGFSTWCITYPASLLLAKEIKTLNPGIPIIFGGPQASILSKETLEKFPYVDFILSGEADYTFPDFLNELLKPKPDFSVIPGLSYRNDSNDIQQNKISGGVKNMDELPFPAYDLITLPKWLKLDVGRGCPYRCTYCSTNDFFLNKYRVKSANRIVNEMIWACENKKITSFSFAHDMFTLNKKFVFDLCNQLISLKKEKRIEIAWTCSARIDCVTEEMLIQMQKAGCAAIFFGIETGSNRMQKIIRKQLDVSRVYEITDICRTIGLDMHASFIFGFPEETKKDIDKTLQCALQLALKGALIQVSELSLLPGTPLYEEHNKKLKFDGRFSNFSSNLCGQEELTLIQENPEIFSSFYYLPVKTVRRSEMYFLCQIINNSSHFRNTLFLLSDLIWANMNKLSLLQLFKVEYNQLTDEDREQNIIVSHWINVFNDLINKTKPEKTFIYDIFTYEAYVALLKTIYTSWHLVHPQIQRCIITATSILKPTPVWKILTSSYKLEKIIPSENRWKENTYRCKKGKYMYLLIAVSEVICKRIRLSEKEMFLLKNLSELSFSEYVKKVKPVLNKAETRLWIKKMQRLGVLEISEQ